MSGGWGIRVAPGTVLAVGGDGGSTLVGAGGKALVAAGVGNAATGFGAGGGGSVVINGSAAVVGVVGTLGLMIVDEYT
jgi:hypothetical protein